MKLDRLFLSVSHATRSFATRLLIADHGRLDLNRLLYEKPRASEGTPASNLNFHFQSKQQLQALDSRGRGLLPRAEMADEGAAAASPDPAEPSSLPASALRRDPGLPRASEEARHWIGDFMGGLIARGEQIGLSASSLFERKWPVC